MGRRRNIYRPAVLVCLALSALLAATGPATAGERREAKLERKVSVLKDKRDALKGKLKVTREQRDEARERISTLEDQQTWLTSHLEGQVSMYQAELAGRDLTIADRDSTIATLTTERDQALSGLPDAIKAVPTADFWKLVFTPARAAWPCDSYYESDGYWSLSFDSTNFCF